MHVSLYEFEFRQDPTTDHGVSCPSASEKSMYNVVHTLAPSFLKESFSFMQVRRATIISWTNSKYSTIRPHFGEKDALERLKKIPLTYNGENLVSILEPLYLTGSFSFLQVTRATIKA